MKRLALSLIGGFAIPFLYTISLALVLIWTERPSLVLRFAYPVNWPTVILVRLLPSGSFPLRPEDRVFLVLLVTIFNVVLYSIPVYLLLSLAFSLRKRRASRVNPPPDPPLFVQQ